MQYQSEAIANIIYSYHYLNLKSISIMGSAGEKMKSCCTHGLCEFDQVNDKVQIAAVEIQEHSTKPSTEEKNKEVIAVHMKTYSKPVLDKESKHRVKVPEIQISNLPKLRIKVTYAYNDLLGCQFSRTTRKRN